MTRFDMRWMSLASAFALASGCGDSGGGAVDLTGKSTEEMTQLIVDVSCETKCPSLGVYCAAPDPMRGVGGGCRADVVVEDLALCKEAGMREVKANLECTPLSEAERNEASTCLNHLRTRECPYTRAELDEIAAAYDGVNSPMVEEDAWPDTCNRLGELLWTPPESDCPQPDPDPRVVEGAGGSEASSGAGAPGG